MGSFRASVSSAAFCAAVFLGAAAGAGPVADKAADIESLIAADDTAGAISAARDLLATVWDMSQSIGFGTTALVTQPAAGYGIYNPRPDDRFKAGEPVIIYAEPIGFDYGAPGDGLNSIGFFVDLRVANAETGELLGNVQNVTELDLTSRYRNREFQANLTYSLDGLAPGKYLLTTTLRDKNSAKSGAFETAIEVVE